MKFSKLQLFYFVLLCFYSNDISCSCDLLVCIPSGPEQGGVKDASDLSSVVFTEPCTIEQALHDQAGKINTLV